ncbi:hypothetical protein CEE37_07740 [candidate division LCP-89 bacterium B3_LCP]|uniref:Secretion system C-terminal sorting domain-containing protein n=1 Tax=candidate division LCP-89 bacterium B3_LCP TaxID=2012998 RepID=A0A532V0W1_UNCL8|nr:MAG: hypothetical protein CEE37_07740 [candidate division LCP-89 bacterium B3_LCP]
MTRWAVLILCGIIIASSVFARSTPVTGKVGPTRQITGDSANDQNLVMDVSNIWTAISNFGRYGDPDANLPSASWPGGSGNDYVWEGRFWVGALVQGKKRVSHADYGDYEFHSAGIGEDPAFLGPDKSIQDSYVIYDDFYPTATHEPLGIKVLQRGLSWSMPEYYEFIGIEYEIVNTGDVGFLPNFYAAWVFDNDVAGLDATEPHIDDNVDYDGWDGDDSDTDLMDIVDPMDLDDDGIDGYDEWGIPYGWSNPDNPNYDPGQIEPDGIYDEYQIYLDDNGPVILGQTGALEGQPIVDAATLEELHGWLISRNMSMIYDGDNNAVQGNDTGERGLPIPCDGWTGGRLIYTPHEPYNTAPEDTLPRPYVHQWWNWNSDPGNDDEKYEYMSATHSAGMGFQFIPNPREIGAPTFDYRWLTSSGPFSFAPYDTLRFVYAFCMGQGLKGVRYSADQAMVAYYAGSTNSSPAEPSNSVEDDHWVLPVPPPIPNLNYTGIESGVRLAWDNHAEFEPDPLLGVSDFEGYKVYRAPYAPTGWSLIYACDNLTDSLVYVITTEGDTLNLGAKIDLDPVGHSFVDTGGVTPWGTDFERPVNNVPYYYAVVSYDTYKPATPTSAEFLSQESARANYLKDPSSGAPMPVYPQIFAGTEEGQDPQGGSAGGSTAYTDLSQVKVVPNPYRGTNLFEARYESIIRFINLPPSCKITLLTLSGDIVQTLDHIDGTDSEAWDLLSKNTQSVVSGLYLYVIETNSEKIMGKFVIAR